MSLKIEQLLFCWSTGANRRYQHHLNCPKCQRTAHWVEETHVRRRNKRVSTCILGLLATPAHTVLLASQWCWVRLWYMGQNADHAGTHKQERWCLPSPPPTTTSFVCHGVVIMPTMPTATSGCTFLAVSTNGTYRNERERGACYAPHIASFLWEREIEGGREGHTW